MNKLKPLEWETIDPYHKRAKVIGGCLIKAYEDIFEQVNNSIQDGYNFRISICFIPDEGHYWKSQN